jgi:hypothetical protein
MKLKLMIAIRPSRVLMSMLNVQNMYVGMRLRHKSVTELIASRVPRWYTSTNRVESNNVLSSCWVWEGYLPDWETPMT